MNTRLPLLLALPLLACDPTATRLTPKRLDFTYATATRSFDAKGNLVLTGFNAPFVVRMNREKQEFQDFSQGLPTDKGPSGEIFADTAGNLAAGGWYRGVADEAWVAVTEPPVSTKPGAGQGQRLTARIYTFDAEGTIFAIMRESADVGELFELYRLPSPKGAWERVAGGASGVNLDASTFKTRLDGTVFLGNQVWAKGRSEFTPLVKCPTSRIDQTCEGGLLVLTHPRRNETYLAKEPSPGASAGKLFRVPAQATFPVEYDALQEIALSAPRWKVNRVSSDGALHVAALVSVTLDYPPYMADEATYYAVTDTARAEARVLYVRGQVVGDHRDIYLASAQLSGGTFSGDPVYVYQY